MAETRFVYTRVLLVPGWKGSDSGHWQSDWAGKHPEYERVQQGDWRSANAEEWVTNLHNAVISSPSPAVLVAHSLGCATVAWWAHRYRQYANRVSAALLAVPPDLEMAQHSEPLPSFPLPPRKALPFPSVLVGSENDPYMSLGTAWRWAEDWGSHFINAGPVGHLNTASGFGPWPRGEKLLDKLTSWSNAFLSREPHRAA